MPEQAREIPGPPWIPVPKVVTSSFELSCQNLWAVDERMNSNAQNYGSCAGPVADFSACPCHCHLILGWRGWTVDWQVCWP